MSVRKCTQRRFFSSNFIICNILLLNKDLSLKRITLFRACHLHNCSFSKSTSYFIIIPNSIKFVNFDEKLYWIKTRHMTRQCAPSITLENETRIWRNPDKCPLDICPRLVSLLMPVDQYAFLRLYLSFLVFQGLLSFFFVWVVYLDVSQLYINLKINVHHKGSCKKQFFS